MNPVALLFHVLYRLRAPLLRLFEATRPGGLRRLELSFEGETNTLVVRFEASIAHPELEVRAGRSVVQRVSLSHQGRQHLARVPLDVLEDGWYELSTRDERNRRYRLYDSSSPHRGEKIPQESVRGEGARRASLLRMPLGPYLRLLVGAPELTEATSSTATLLHTRLRGTRLTLRGMVSSFAELDEAVPTILVARTSVSPSNLPVGEVRTTPKRIRDGRESYSFRASVDIEELRAKHLFLDRTVRLELVLPTRGGTALLPIRALRLGPLRKSFGEILHRVGGSSPSAGVVVRLTRPGALVLSHYTPPPEENLAFKLKELAAFFLHLAMLRRRRKTWILFEALSSTAQDNAYVFFRWLLENNRTENVPYYLIRRDSPQFDELAPFRKNVIEYGTFRHLFELLACRALVSSQGREHAYYLYAKSSLYKRALLKKPLVFLQHGVTAFKRSPFQKTPRTPGTADLIIAVSEEEKRIMVNQWRYDPGEVEVTGFPRFDVLEDHSREQPHPLVLVMPTWRAWLADLDEVAFRETSFYRSYQGLLDSPELHRWLDENDAELAFLGHVRIAGQSGIFHTRHPRVRLVEFGAEPVNVLLMKAALLVTDYSSVAWDFAYMGKQVHFFRFDLPKYLAVHGSYVDLEKPDFGVVHKDLGQLITALTSTELIDDPKTVEDRRAAMSRAFAYSDKNNSERVYQAILEHQHRWSGEGIGLSYRAKPVRQSALRAGEDADPR